MALDVSAGTETLHAASYGVITAATDLIFGAQHHIYTVLSTICCCRDLGTAGTDIGRLQIIGNNNFVTGSAQTMHIAQWLVVVNETFVWNDKFSFNGFEGETYTEPMSTNAEQLIIAAQGSAVPQQYQIFVTDSDVDMDCHVTFIDQNNA
jgi:hypothetical protein|tara:strand:- start:1179 stop:1628 length:450 start_codon:yes stop_codon:yes gene_type:complete